MMKRLLTIALVLTMAFFLRSLRQCSHEGGDAHRRTRNGSSGKNAGGDSG